MDPQRPTLLRRVVGIAIDWMACLAITFGLIGQLTEITPAQQSWYPLLILFVEHAILVPFAGGSLGHRLLGMAVAPLHRPQTSILQGVIRVALLCLVIPAVITDGNGDGMHDRAAGTRVIRTS